MHRQSWWGVLVLLWSSVSHGAELPASAAEALQAHLRALGLETVTLAQLPVQPGPIADSYEVMVGTFRFQFSADASLVVYDQRFSFTHDDASKNAPDAQAARRQTLAWLDEAQMLVFEPSAPLRHTLTVFTDVTCPYSQALHKDVPKLQAQGIRVRYLAFPREGIDSLGAQRLREVWCDADRAQALAQAMDGIQPLADLCDTPVAQHYQLGSSFGVEGTPTLIFEDGRLLTGYLEPEALLANIHRHQSSSSVSTESKTE